MPIVSRSYNPVWNLVDLTGQELDDTYYVFFLENTIPYIPATVYSDYQGNIPLANPVQVSAAGTIGPNLFFNTEQIYRIEIRAGNSQADALTWLIENYVPIGYVGTTPVVDAKFDVDNQITNSQFVLLTSPGTKSFTATGTFEVAPGWNLILSGSGTATAVQTGLNSANITPTNAPYALQLDLTAWTGTAILNQRFAQTGVLWSEEYVSMQFTARLLAGSATTVSANLIDSLSTPLASFEFDNGLTSAFNIFADTKQLIASTDTQVPPAAYINFNINLPNSRLEITSVQILPTSTFSNLGYGQETVERQVDHLFHYYNLPLQYKPIPSYLVGWDFVSNPVQALGATVAAFATGANTSNYMADQTIVFQTANSGIALAKNATGFTFTATIASSFSIIQYLPNTTALEILVERMAVQLKGKTSGSNLVGNVRLYWTANATAPDIKTPTFASLVSGITAGVPSVVSGWTQVPRNLGEATFALNTAKQTFNFSGFDATAAALIDTATFFAYVITFNTLAAAATVSLDYASLCGGDIATHPAPKTPDTVLRECQYYYERSYEAGTASGTSTTTGMVIEQMPAAVNGVACAMYANHFAQTLKQTKLSAAYNLTLYSTDGTINSILCNVINSTTVTPQIINELANPQPNPIPVAGVWSVPTTSKQTFSYPISTAAAIVNSVAGTSGARGWIQYQYVADSRIGVF